jgi:DtxR family Mn-dependent transcriptional regulator
METVKHYVETIFYIRHEEGRVRPGRLADWLGVSAPTVTVTLQRLARDGWVTVGADRSVSLTAQGNDLAESIVRVHRLLERWLTDVLGLDWAAADQEAQHLAPGVSERVADMLDERLGRPATCPHGNLIPGRLAPYGKLVALADLEPGVPARVRRISEVAEHDAPELLRELDAYGLVTGARIAVAQADRSVQAIPVEVGDRTRPIGTEVARLIWVEPESARTRRAFSRQEKGARMRAFMSGMSGTKSMEDPHASFSDPLSASNSDRGHCRPDPSPGGGSPL